MSVRIKKAWDTILGGQVICAECLQVCDRRGPTQKYCQVCANKKEAQRQNAWAKKNPASKERIKAQGEKKRSHLLDVGSETSNMLRWNSQDVFPDESGLSWVRRFSFPFSWDLSKNSLYRVRGVNAPTLFEQARKAMNAVQAVIVAGLDSAPVVEGKVWVDLLVEKPNHRGDAINFVDMLSDVAKRALKLDDRWFAYRRIDWRVIKKDPFIHLGLAQETACDMRICSYCGRLLPLSGFCKNASMSKGHSRCCLDCMAIGSLRKRKPT